MTEEQKAVIEAAKAFCSLPECIEDREQIEGSNSASYPAEFANLMDAVRSLEKAGDP